MTFALDHLVINALFDMDRAADLMSRLGFTLTPRGYHSLGSINHLVMFEHDYLELIGLPSGTDVLRKDVLESPRGLNGLVFQASDIDACQRRLRDSGLDMLEPQSFSRPVTIDGVEHLARFRTVRTAPELVRGRTGLLLPALHAGTGLASPVDVASQWRSGLKRTGDRDFRP